MLKKGSFNNSKSDITKFKSADYDVTDCVTLNCAKDRKSTRLNSSHDDLANISRMPSSA